LHGNRGAILGILVLVHGHFGRKENHLPVSERFCAIGFRCLLFDVPDHGEHPSPTTTFALNEAMLPRAVLESAAQRSGFDPRPAGLFVALSLGGAIALIAAVQERDADIHSVVAELSSFAILSQVIEHEARRFGPLSRPTAALM
jgi:pimeloyl-ACP methyl ester carboxylesterase